MASDGFLQLVEQRRSNYTLSAESTIPDAKVVEIVQAAIKWAPASYNVQSARAVVLFRDQHRQFWDLAATHIAAHVKNLPLDEATKAFLVGRMAGFKAAYGTVLWFEDQAALDGLAKLHANVVPLLKEFSDSSSGMHQFIVWTALTAEGLGASLQHINSVPTLPAETLSTFGLPETWVFKAQLVFGKPTAPPMDKMTPPLGLPLETRVLVKE
ncbi:hypothetical protein A1O3_02107 [Capronia epimyces CBS 606.96]|uniref:Nitroreductase domain-containing protein n=1 Tax=Capronia epimyces CBS 606.96 TaxID=1182542 RepID=W9Y928_9EURO|nr:uncharacterized protein A1O3_02107 [Capronia epimyces CBS 606.96]EXJ89043.1 hypothetical protein A1O3_02107 [Capronia epimyces CBS 606.96]